MNTINMNENSDSDLIGQLNRLFEKLHQTGGNHQGSTVINIYGKGSQHIDHVEEQYFYGYTSHKPPVKMDDGEPPSLPDVLNTEEARNLWQKAIDAGWVDENFQPLISRTQAALLADAMAKRLAIKEKWKVFELLWNRKNMYRDYYKALYLQQSLAFQDKIKILFDE